MKFVFGGNLMIIFLFPHEIDIKLCSLIFFFKLYICRACEHIRYWGHGHNTDNILQFVFVLKKNKSLLAVIWSGRHIQVHCGLQYFLAWPLNYICWKFHDSPPYGVWYWSASWTRLCKMWLTYIVSGCQVKSHGSIWFHTYIYALDVIAAIYDTCPWVIDIREAG